jgi:hypothetical protein
VRTIALDHNELVRAVQQAMAAQLARDGYTEPGIELGLLFSSHREDDLTVIGSVRRHGQVLCELKGSRNQLCAIATQLALTKLTLGERQGLRQPARVRWRVVHFTDDSGGEGEDRFMADVEFDDHQ